MLSDLRQQKSQSTGVIDYSRKASSKLYGSLPSLVCGGLFTFLFGFALPVAEIVIGEFNLDFVRVCVRW